MARDTITVTDEWQQIGAGKLVITVLQSSKQALLFNETASDVNAWSGVPPNGRQFWQDEALDTYVRATDPSAAWILLTDGVLP